MKGTIITNNGLKLIAKLAASEAALTFTRAAVGTGQVPTGYDAAGMNGLNEYAMDGNIASYGVCEDAEDTAYVVFQVSSIGLKTGFMISEAGLFANDPDEGEILYAYFDMTDDPQYIYSEGKAVSKFIEMTLNVVIGRAKSVTALINPGSLITRTGDIAETVINKLDIPETEFPIPDAGEKTKSFLGKVKKSMEDWKNFKNGIITLGMLSNQYENSTDKIPTSALVYALKHTTDQLNDHLGVKHFTDALLVRGNAVLEMQHCLLTGNTKSVSCKISSRSLIKDQKTNILLINNPLMFPITTHVLYIVYNYDGNHGALRIEPSGDISLWPTVTNTVADIYINVTYI